jgi:hypothetical protein
VTIAIEAVIVDRDQLPVYLRIAARRCICGR